MKTITKTKLIKSLVAAMLIAFTFTALSCNQPSSPSNDSENANSSNNEEEEGLPSELLVKAENIINTVKSYNWISSENMTTKLKLKLENNKIIVTHADSGKLYYEFDVTIPDAINVKETNEHAYYWNHDFGECLKADADIYIKTNDSHDIVINMSGNGEPYKDTLDYKLMVDSYATGDSLFDDCFDFVVDLSSSSGSGASNQEIINSIKGNWNYSGIVANQQRTVNVTITENKITLSWAGENREANYTVNNGKLRINYTASAQNGTTTDYSGEFNVTLESNSFKLTGSGADASQIYAMFFGMTTTASSYEITFTK